MCTKRLAAAVFAAIFTFSLFTGASYALPCLRENAKAPVLTAEHTPMGSVDFELQAASMALIEGSTGTLIAEQNCDLELPMASTTKIMTAFIVLKYCSLDDIVKVPDEAVSVEGSSMYLCRDEHLTVRDLLYGLMLASGNDAAVALACHVAGSSERFAALMNDEARVMGLSSTHFVTPNGLHAEGHRTTAYELCIIAKAALAVPEFREIVSTKYYTAESGDHTRTFKNKNTLLWDYEGAMGVKTGYTMAAGRCLVFAAEREGMTVIGAVLNCRPMFEIAERLLDYAFDNYTVCTVVPEGQRAASVKVENGTKSILAAVTKNSIITVMHKGERASFSAEVSLYRLSAPVSAGDTVGFITVSREGEVFGKTELVASSDIPMRDMSYWLRLLIGSFV